MTYVYLRDVGTKGDSCWLGCEKGDRGARVFIMEGERVVMDNNEIKAAVDVCAMHILGKKLATKDDLAAIALVTSCIQALHEIAYQLQVIAIQMEK